MVFFQFRTGAAFLVTLEDLDVIFEVELLKEPDDSLRARLLEPEVFRKLPCLFLRAALGVGRCFAFGGGLFTCNLPVDVDLCTLLIRHFG